MGLDDRTALLVDPQGRAEVSGEGSVTVLQRIAETQVEATPLRPPHVRSLRMDVLGDGYAIDMNTLQIVGHPSNAAPVLVEPVLEASTPVTLSGSDAEAAKQGSLALEFESAYALFDGDLEVVAGTGALPGFLVVSQTFAQSQSSMVENRVGGVQWALHEAGATVPFSLLLDEGAVVTVDATGKFLAQSVESEPAVLILDGLGLEETARTPYLPRQSVSLLGLRLHLLRSGEDWAKPKGR
jgi:cyanophycinase-like exopeptidase